MLSVRWFKTLIVVLVCVNLSGVLQLAHADAPDLDALTAPSAALEEKAQGLILRARHSDRPGVEGGAPKESEIEDFGKKLLDWKPKLEAALASDSLAVPDKLALMNLYFEHLTSLVIVRIAMEMPHGKNWRKSFGLCVPSSVAQDFNTTGAASKSRLGDRLYPLIRETKGDVRVFNLSETLVNGLELGQNADNPSSKNFLTLMQYLTIRQLLQNLASVAALRKDRALPSIALPTELTDKLHSLLGIDDLMAEQAFATEEPATRMALADTYEVPIALAPKFADDAFARSVLDLILSAYPKSSRAKVKKEALPLLKEVLDEAEKSSLKAVIEEEAMTLPGFVSQDSPENIASPLRSLISNAKAAAILDHLARAIGESPTYQTEKTFTTDEFKTQYKERKPEDTVLEQPQEGRVIVRSTVPVAGYGIPLPAQAAYEVIGLVEARRQKYQAAITDGTVKAWVEAARDSAKDAIYTKRRTELVQDLLVQSTDLALGLKAAKGADPADPSILARVLAPDLYTMRLRGSTQDWMTQTVRAGSYAAARDQFTELMAQITEPTVLRNGLVNPALVERYVEKHDFRPDLEFSGAVNAKLAEEVIQEVVAARKKDVRDFLDFGRRMGFLKIQYRKDTPRVDEILSGKQVDRYFDLLREDIVDKYHLLATKIEDTDERGTRAEIPLYKALHRLNPSGTTSPEIESEAAELIERALEGTQRTILDKIQEVARAKKIETIEDIATSSVMMELMLQGFPEYKREKDAIIERLTSPDLTDQFMHRYIGKTVTYGFTAIAIMHVAVKWGTRAKWFRRKPYLPNTSFAEAMMNAAEPMVKAYMKSAVFLVVADTVYQWNELMRVKKTRDERREWFGASATGRNFFKQQEVQAATSAYAWARGFFIGRIALDGPFMYFPEAKEIVTKLGTKIAQREIAADLRAFQDLALRPGAWEELDAALDSLRKSEDIIGSDFVRRAERAYVRLNGKVRSGETWDLGMATDPLVATPFMSKPDQKLRRALIANWNEARK